MFNIEDMKDINGVNKILQDHEKRIRVLENRGVATRSKVIPDQSKTQSTDELILSIVNKTGECDESEEIQNKILGKTSMEGKILLCFYISYKYFKNAWLDTGDIEKITSNLGVKIDVRNASNKIKELRRYLESGKFRKKGRPTPYRLNRKGVKRFEEIIHAQKA